MSHTILKTPEELSIMKESGAILASIMGELVDLVSVGVNTQEFERLTIELINKHNVTSSFIGYEGFKYHVITCINDEVVHGLPLDRELATGDLLSLDLAIIHNGFHTDMARTVTVGDATPEVKTFLSVGKRALTDAIDKAVVGNRLGDIGHAIQSNVEGKGYSVVRAFVGHGIGRDMHEDPQVFGFGTPGTGELLKEGMVIAIEVMANMGGYEVVLLDDGWTAVTEDGSRSLLIENTVAITKDGPVVLTSLPL